MSARPGRPRRGRVKTGAEELLEAQTERQHQAAVEGLLRFYGWRYHHSPDNRPVDTGKGRRGRQRTGSRGFPDLIATRRLAGYGPELLIAELKTEHGRYGPGQEEWLADLAAFAAALEAEVMEANPLVPRDQAPALGVYTWRPSDVASGEVERILAGPRGVGFMVDPADEEAA
jgi:hypothetical protein